MQFYSRTDTKTWNALEFIRLFWKHSRRRRPLTLFGRGEHCTHSQWIFSFCSCVQWQDDVENSMFNWSIDLQDQFHFSLHDFEGSDIFVERLKSGESSCVRSGCGKSQTMLKLITHHWIWLEANGIVWVGSDAPNKYCIHNFHNFRIHINRKFYPSIAVNAEYQLKENDCNWNGLGLASEGTSCPLKRIVECIGGAWWTSSSIGFWISSIMLMHWPLTVDSRRWMLR